MLQIFEGETANDVWLAAATKFRDSKDVQIQSGRGGPTFELLHVGLSIRDPRQRWIMSRFPAINPAFVLAEVIWIVNGRNESDFVNYWNSQLPKYAGDGIVYHGAYGFRLRQQFGIDQLERAYKALKHNSASRQIVLQIWDPKIDFPNEDGSAMDADIPCNVISLLKVRNRKLEWTQIMRSNDLFLGIPHNIIQFTSLQEIIAGWLSIEVGSYNHFSDSLHLYKQNQNTMKVLDINIEKNTDTLTLSKKESEKIFAILYQKVEMLTSPRLTQDKLHEISKEWDAPEAYRNILLVLAAEAARKRNWKDISTKLISNCTNPIFRQAWKRWLMRFKA
jgi:thymidylate synthase